MNLNYKVVCTDIDGTLLNKDRVPSEQTIKEIKRIKDQVPIILVSSRMPKAMKYIQTILGIEHFPIISYNGGLVLTYETGQSAPQVLLSISIPFEVTKSIFMKIQNTNIHMGIYTNDDWYVEKIDYWASREINNTRAQPITHNFSDLLKEWQKESLGPHKIMCMSSEEDINELEEFVRQYFGNLLNIYRSKPTYLELSSKLVSKATAIKKLLTEKMGYTMEETIAFGDNYNDIEMLEAVGLGIAVANGNKELKNVAKEVTLSNIDDGVAASIRKYFL